MNLVERLMGVVRGLDWSDQKEPILKAINRIEELEKENAELKLIIATDTGTESAVSALQAKLKIAVEVLEKLACLGNGDRQGNSIGNYMAQYALIKIKGDV